jgi:hypothetical protein
MSVVARVFIERWLTGEGGDVVLELVYEESTCCYEVHSPSERVFYASEFSAALQWLLGVAVAVPEPELALALPEPECALSEGAEGIPQPPLPPSGRGLG